MLGGGATSSATESAQAGSAIAQGNSLRMAGGVNVFDRCIVDARSADANTTGTPVHLSANTFEE
jgi:hypothetical protein